MAGCRGDCPFLVQIGWRYFSLFTDTWARQGLTSNLSKHITCVSRTYFNLSLSLKINLHTSLCLSPGKLSECSLSKHLTCVSRIYSQLQPKIGRLPISLYLPPGKLSESSLSKHLTCVSRTYSQPQPVEIFSMLISRQVVGVFTVQTPHLCLQDLLPTSACRDILSISKNMSSLAINWQVTFNKWPYSQHATKMKWDKNTSHESRILELFDALDFTSAMHQPSDHFRTLAQAQYRSRENLGAQYKRSQLHLRWRP